MRPSDRDANGSPDAGNPIWSESVHGGPISTLPLFVASPARDRSVREPSTCRDDAHRDLDDITETMNLKKLCGVLKVGDAELQMRIRPCASDGSLSGEDTCDADSRANGLGAVGSIPSP